MQESERLRLTLRRLTGYIPGQVADIRLVSKSTDAGGHLIEELILATDTEIPATLIRPARDGPFPAVIYCHAHGGDHHLGRRELLDGSAFLQSPGYGRALANLGFAALAIDHAGFGQRRSEGSESALAKAALWNGTCLFGRMLNDLSFAIGSLAARPDIRADRIFSLGLSMGAAHAVWLAALDDRLAGSAHLCMLADIAPLLSSGIHDRHGHYLTVPGLLQHCEFGDVAGLVAPKPQLICHGGQDGLTPRAARDAALARARAAYDLRPGLDGNALQVMLDPESGHAESAHMRAAVLDFLSNAQERTSPFAA